MSYRFADRLLVSNAVPLDLVGAAVVAAATVATVVSSGPLAAAARPVVSALLTLFVVGYSLLAVLFPRGATSLVQPVERLLLAVGLSVVVTPLVALLVVYSPVALTPNTTLLAVAGVTGVTTAIGFLRYQPLAEPGRSRSLLAAVTAWRSKPWLDIGLDLLVVASIVFATLAVGTAVFHVPPSEPYTELTIVGATGSAGNALADGGPVTLTAGEPTTLSVAIGNREHQTVEYTVFVVLQGESSSTTDGELIEQLRVVVPADETRTVEHTVEPSIVGEGLRLRYLLFKGDAPGDPAAREPYRSVSLVVDISPAPSDS